MYFSKFNGEILSKKNLRIFMLHSSLESPKWCAEDIVFQKRRNVSPARHDFLSSFFLVICSFLVWITKFRTDLIFWRNSTRLMCKCSKSPFWYPLYQVVHDMLCRSTWSVSVRPGPQFFLSLRKSIFKSLKNSLRNERDRIQMFFAECKR